MLFILFFLTIYYQCFYFNYAFANKKSEKSGYYLEPLIIKPNEDSSEIKYSRISDKKCKEYQEPIYDLWHQRDTYSGRHIINYIENCPHYIKPYIAGGSNAEPKEFPHMALIGSSTHGFNWFCGGTLISEEFVLTAAHCSAPDDTVVANIIRLGDLDYNCESDDAQHQDFVIIDKIIHEDFNRTQAYDDIALFKVDRKVKFSRYIRPACLSTNLADYNNEYVIATGWGATVNSGGSSKPSNVLKRVVVETFSYEECDEEFRKIKNRKISQMLPNYIDNKTQICFGSHTDKRDTCGGDSGGPLQIYHHNNKQYSCMYSIIGITSASYLCGVKSPGIYVRIYSYLDWLENKIWPNEKL